MEWVKNGFLVEFYGHIRKWLFHWGAFLWSWQHKLGCRYADLMLMPQTVDKVMEDVIPSGTSTGAISIENSLYVSDETKKWVLAESSVEILQAKQDVPRPLSGSFSMCFKTGGTDDDYTFKKHIETLYVWSNILLHLKSCKLLVNSGEQMQSSQRFQLIPVNASLL